MTPEQTKVKEWMLQAKQACPSTPHVFVGDKTKHLRLELIGEEYKELVVASLNNNIVEIADALADLLYVIYGTGVAYGIDLEPIFNEVHRSNMSKLTDCIIREDGKILKGPHYSPPVIEPLLKQQYQEKFNEQS
jgi:phosphoribosyl-ATP pyrophosphohydrolase